MIITPIFIYLFISLLLINFQWTENKFVAYFVAIILIYCFRNLSTAYAIDLNNLNINPTILSISDLLAYLTGPLTHYLFKSLIKGKFVFDYKLIVLCLPMLLLGFNLLPEFGLIDYEKSTTLFWSFDFQLKLISTSNFTFILISFYLYFKAKKTKKLKTINDYYLKSIVTIFIITSSPRIVLVLSTLSLSNLRNEIESIYLSNNQEILYFITILTPLSILLFPKLIYGNKSNSLLYQYFKKFTRSIAKQPYKIFYQEPDQSTDLVRIVDYIENQKSYLNPDFSLHTISRDLNIPLLRVSKCLNKDLNVRFIEYRNKKRIEYSISLFKQNTHKIISIEGIALKCGFKNRVSFYNAFKMIYGQTPYIWIKNNIH